MKKTNQVTPRLLRTRAAAQYVGLSAWRLRKLVQDGKLPVVCDEGSCLWRLDIRDLDAYIEKNKVTLS